MKQKKYFILAAAAILMAACSENDIAEKQSPQVTGEGDPVNFSAYMNRSTTRAGQMGTLTTATLQSGSEESKDETGGFGVFGYYTNDELYSQNSKPEFFYNQKVYYNAGSWTYSPIKYWPNEFGSSAESQAEDRLTFFAYAPYVPVDVSTGIAKTTGSPAEDKLETGIISVTRNTTLGDPYVKYYVSFDPEECVDLCFGVAKNEFKSSVDGLNNNVLAGAPYVDVKKPTLNDRIFFDFKHALAQLNVQIDADVDEMSHGLTGLATGTKIYVREVTFEGFADKGMLNLNSEAKTADYTPKWVDLSGINEIKSGKVTIYDGRRDGREGQVNAEASNEKPQNLNSAIIQNSSATDGVLGTAYYNLFASSTVDKPILVIPTGEDLRITIVYDVETADDNLATFLSNGTTHGSSVENKITKAITLNGSNLKLAAGKSYRVNLHLGMTSVKFDAAVTEWSDVSTGDVDLPVNAPTYIAGNAGTINLPSAAALTNQKFILSGITGNDITASAGGTVIDGTPTDNVAGNSATITYATKANTTVNNRSEPITFTEVGGSATTTIITFNQPAGKLGLSIPDGTAGVAESGLKITVNCSATLTAATDWDAFNYTVVRKRDGVSKTFTKVNAAPTAINTYKVTGTSTTAADIDFYTDDEFKVGDEYTITVQAGDAVAETKTIVIGGITYPSSARNLYKVKGSSKFINAPVGPGTITYAKDAGTVVKTLDSGTGEVELNTTTGTGKSVVTATSNAAFTTGTNIYYTENSKKASYNVYLTDVNVDGVYEVVKAGGAVTIYVGELPISNAETITNDNASVFSAEPAIASGEGPKAANNGIAKVTATLNENTTGAARTVAVTVNGCKFYIRQAGI